MLSRVLLIKFGAGVVVVVTATFGFLVTFKEFVEFSVFAQTKLTIKTIKISFSFIAASLLKRRLMEFFLFTVFLD